MWEAFYSFRVVPLKKRFYKLYVIFFERLVTWHVSNLRIKSILLNYGWWKKHLFKKYTWRIMFIVVISSVTNSVTRGNWFPKITWKFIYSNFAEVAKFFILLTTLKRFKFLGYQISFCFDVTFIIRKKRKNIILPSESPKIPLKWSFLTLLEISSKVRKLSINGKPIHH